MLLLSPLPLDLGSPEYVKQPDVIALNRQSNVNGQGSDDDKGASHPRGRKKVVAVELNRMRGSTRRRGRKECQVVMTFAMTHVNDVACRRSRIWPHKQRHCRCYWLGLSHPCGRPLLFLELIIVVIATMANSGGLILLAGESSGFQYLKYDICVGRWYFGSCVITLGMGVCSAGAGTGRDVIDNNLLYAKKRCFS